MTEVVFILKYFHYANSGILYCFEDNYSNFDRFKQEITEIYAFIFIFH